MPLISPKNLCSHDNPTYIGFTKCEEGVSKIIVYWCPKCGAIKRRTIDFNYKEYPWQLPENSK
jgi:hypothetical protein